MINAVISEFNPFHNGHKYLLETAKQKTGADYTVCFMSGNFVQRGEIAFADKHTRARAAVRHGADLVIQLPTAHTVANASVFADAGVFCANSLGQKVSLCFGSESEDISPLFNLANADTDALSEAIKQGVKQGKSFAKALMDAYGEVDPAGAKLLSKPNNLLAFEYIKAIIHQKSDITPVNILRKGIDHDADVTSDEFASASYIRQNTDTDRFMPEKIEGQIDKDKFDTLLLYSVMSKTPDELLKFADMTEGLENRFIEAVKTAKTPEELFDAVKSKRYTHAKIRRAALSVLLQNPKGLCKTPVPYLKVLAFNDNGRQLLKELSKTCTLPIVTKSADAQTINKTHFALECRASDLYSFCRIDQKPLGLEYTHSPVYIK